MRRFLRRHHHGQGRCSSQHELGEAGPNCDGSVGIEHAHGGNFRTNMNKPQVDHLEQRAVRKQHKGSPLGGTLGSCPRMYSSRGTGSYIHFDPKPPKRGTFAGNW